jgi:hypothetical protein
MRHLLVCAILVVGCSRLTAKQVEPTAPGPDQVEALRAAYQSQLDTYNAEMAPAHGWPSETDCDGTLWAGEACAGGAGVAIARAEYSPGEIHRRPAPACWTAVGGDQGAKTTVSRDALTGYLACLWAQKDLIALQRLADYAEDHSFVMGEPLDDGRVLLGTNLSGLLGRMVYALSGGGDERPWSLAFEAYAPVAEDYEQHTQAVDIGLQGDVVADLRARGLDAGVGAIELLDISPGMKARLDELAAAHPDDYLFQAERGVYTGDFSDAIRLLLTPPTPPSYVRGDRPDHFESARWLFAARRVLDRFSNPE